nr:hypothetical protein 9 [Gammaproteobacteria bacterium]
MSDDIMQQQYFEMLARSQLNEAQIASAKETLSKSKEIMDKHHEAKAHINNDARLSAQGKEADLAVLSQGTYEQLKNTLGAEMNSLDKRIGELTYQLRPQAPSKDSVVEELRQQEVRAHLREMDALKVLELYESLAVSGDNDLVMRAVEEAPFPLIDNPEIIVAGQRSRAERNDPKSAKLLVQMKQWRSVIEGALNTAQAELGIAEDYLQRVAEKGAA